MNKIIYKGFVEDIRYAELPKHKAEIIIKIFEYLATYEVHEPNHQYHNILRSCFIDFY